MEKKEMMSLIERKEDHELEVVSFKIKRKIKKKLTDNKINISKTVQNLLERIAESL